MESQQDGQGWSPWGGRRGRELGLFSLEMAVGHLLLAQIPDGRVQGRQSQGVLGGVQQ